jgi:hypothetical protein
MNLGDEYKVWPEAHYPLYWLPPVISDPLVNPWFSGFFCLASHPRLLN